MVVEANVNRAFIIPPDKMGFWFEIPPPPADKENKPLRSWKQAFGFVNSLMKTQLKKETPIPTGSTVVLFYGSQFRCRAELVPGKKEGERTFVVTGEEVADAVH